MQDTTQFDSWALRIPLIPGLNLNEVLDRLRQDMHDKRTLREVLKKQIDEQHSERSVSSRALRLFTYNAHDEYVKETFWSLIALPSDLFKNIVAFDRICARISQSRRYLKVLRVAFENGASGCFCGLEPSKKVWFLLHGTVPPPTGSMFTLDAVLGMARH